MAKRKASASVAQADVANTAAPGETSKAAADAATQEYRKYLLANAGATVEDTIVPVAKKRKLALTVAPKKSNIEDGEAIATAKIAEGQQPGTPRNAVKKPKAASRKRKGVQDTPSTEATVSPESSEGLKQDSVTGSTPPQDDGAEDNATTNDGNVEATVEAPAPKRKTAPKKRNAATTPSNEDETLSPKTKPAPKKRKAAISPSKEGVDGETPPKSKAAPKKRKAVAHPRADDPTEAPPPKRKRASPKTAEGQAAAPEYPVQLAPPPPTELSSIVAAKVANIHNFIAAADNSESPLNRDSTNSSLVIVTELDVLAAIMCLRVDFEIGYQDDAHLSDIESCIVNRFTAPFRQVPAVAWLTINFAAATTKLEHEILDKVRGHGLEGVNLLEIELEVQKRQTLQTVAIPPPVVSAPADLQATWNAIFAGVLEKEKKAIEVKRAEEEAAAAARERQGNTSSELCDNGGVNEKHRGVCPLPPIAAV